MNTEKEYDSSTNDYIVISEPDEKYIKQQYWDMAIGLQKVDGLTPSKYMLQLVDKNVNGEINNQDVEDLILNYHKDKEESEKECDIVSTRIVKLINDNSFSFSPISLKNIHEYLFKDIYSYAGNYRNCNITKEEKILNKKTVNYANYNEISNILEYDFNTEKNYDYSNLNINDKIKHFAKFTSDIWQVHPFREGNTRTTAVLMVKYLQSLGYDVNNEIFKRKSVYFRNALVRSNYYNDYLNVKEDKSYLTKFYENLLLGKNNNLSSEDLIVKELF